MAGDWIKMRTGLSRHPKIVRMASALSADRLRVIGGLHAVWCLFDEHSEDGNLEGYSPQVVDDLIGWEGFTSALILVGWAEEHGESLCLPEFESHNGQSAKRRAMEADRKREARKSSAVQADKIWTREEKRREENTKRQKEQQLVQPTAARSRFDDFWDVYPNKKGKESARKTWQRRKLDPVADNLIAHVRLMLDRDDGWRRGFIPMGSTYLNQARWEDEPTGPPVDRPVNGNASAPSKTLTAIQKLQAMKNGQVDSERDHGRVEQAALPGT